MLFFLGPCPTGPGKEWAQWECHSWVPFLFFSSFPLEEDLMSFVIMNGCGEGGRKTKAAFKSLRSKRICKGNWPTINQERDSIIV
jgi:hypothetical protein